MGDDNGSGSNTAIRVAIITGIFTICAALLTIFGGPLIEDWRQSRRPTDRPFVLTTAAPTDPPVVLTTEAPTEPPIEPATEPPIATGELVINDGQDSLAPDFLTLVVRYDAQQVHLVIALGGVDSIGKGELIYMHGTYADAITLYNDGTFSLDRDNDSNGHLEELLYSGTIEKTGPSTISLKIPIEYLPDISNKKVWAYSQQSKDRIPDEGAVYFPTPVP